LVAKYLLSTALAICLWKKSNWPSLPIGLRSSPKLKYNDAHAEKKRLRVEKKKALKMVRRGPGEARERHGRDLKRPGRGMGETRQRTRRGTNYVPELFKFKISEISISSNPCFEACKIPSTVATLSFPCSLSSLSKIWSISPIILLPVTAAWRGGK
jgi:hypothetical protein